jgi:hypothetical protein
MTAARFKGRSRRRHVEEPQKSQFVGQLLSLFIMLVAFFIVLNSISIYDSQKSDNAIQSVGQSVGGVFAAPLIGNEVSSANDFWGGPPAAQGEGNSFEDRVTGAFSSLIAGDKPALMRERGVLYLHMTEDAFNTALGDDRTGPFNKSLAALINNSAQGIDYRMEITFNLGANPAQIAAASPDQAKTLAAKYQKVAAAIEGRGFPTALLSVGAAGGEAGTVDIFFRPEEKLDPQSGSKLVEGR